MQQSQPSITSDTALQLEDASLELLCQIQAFPAGSAATEVLLRCGAIRCKGLQITQLMAKQQAAQQSMVAAWMHTERTARPVMC